MKTDEEGDGFVHLIRNTFRYAARQYWDEMARDLRPVYTAPSKAAAKERFVEFSTKWGRQYPAITRLWENAWSDFVRFLDYDVEIRRVICSQCHRVRQRPLPAGGQGQGPFPHRAGGPEVPLPGDAGTRPHRQRKGTMGHKVEAGTECLRHQLRWRHGSAGPSTSVAGITTRTRRSPSVSTPP